MSLTAEQIDLAGWLRRLIIESPTGCQLVQGGLHKSGYAHLWLESKHQYAHRYVYQRVHGVVLPRELVVDHLCRVRNCVNPQHLEAVTQQVNILRGVGTGAQHAVVTHCPQGHEYAGSNLIERVVARTGRLRRDCRACQREWNRAYSKRRYYAQKAARS